MASGLPVGVNRDKEEEETRGLARRTPQLPPVPIRATTESGEYKKVRSGERGSVDA